MALDSSIVLQYRPVQIENPMNALAQAYQIKGAQAQNALADMNIQAHQKALDDQNALAEIARASFDQQKGAIDPARYRTGMLQRGLVSQLQAFDKAQLEQEGTRAKIDADKAKVKDSELARTRESIKARGQVLGSLLLKPQVTHDDVAGAMQTLVNNGHMSSEQAVDAMSRVPADPAQLRPFLENARNQVLEIDKQLPTFSTVDTGGKIVRFQQLPGQAPTQIGEIEKTAAPQQATFQNTDDGKQIITYKVENGVRTEVGRIKKSATPGEMLNYNAKMAEIANGGKPPQGYRWAGNGTLEAIPGGPGDPKVKDSGPPTEFQGKSGIFGARAEEANRVLESLNGEYSPFGINVKQGAGGVWGIGGALEMGANKRLSPKTQQAEQAQRDFINAVLRQESGASIAPSEFDNAKKQYFPQPGDSPEVIAQKSRNRQIAVEGLKRNAGKAAFSANGSPASAPAAAPTRSSIPNPWKIEEVR